MRIIITLIATILITASCNRTPPEETRTLAIGETDSVVVVPVPGAVCYKCQNVIEGGLKDELGVKQSILNLHTKQVSIVYSPTSTTAEALEEKVASLIPDLPCN